MNHTDICNAAGLKESAVIEGELTEEEIAYFQSEAERIFSIFVANYKPKVFVENGHLLVDYTWEIAPAVELHETICETIFFRSYIIGTWKTISNYPFEPDDVEIAWNWGPTQAQQVIPSIGARMMERMIPESMIDEQRLPKTVILKQKKHPKTA